MKFTPGPGLGGHCIPIDPYYLSWKLKTLDSLNVMLFVISIINSRFYCSILESTEAGKIKSIVPSISGRGWITGTYQLMCDPDDPWPYGYKLSDTWPNSNRLNTIHNQ